MGKKKHIYTVREMKETFFKLCGEEYRDILYPQKWRILPIKKKKGQKELIDKEWARRIIDDKENE